MNTTKERFNGLESLTTAVIVIDGDLSILYANSAAENLLEISSRSLTGQLLPALFTETASFIQLIDSVKGQPFNIKRQLLELRRLHGRSLHVHATASTPDSAADRIILELQEVERQLKVERESRMLDQSQANRELIRNLAHEIKNPLGGIRGAAQLLEGELDSDDLKEYTQVIIKESDRLQTLVDRLLAPHRKPHVVALMNIHEVCERVRSVVLAEHPVGMTITRDYDTSIPEFMGDFEQLIQTVLNIVRNGAEALAQQIADGSANITLRTRVVRQLTVNRRRHRLALDLQVIDNGPGIPAEIKEIIFFQLVSGREGGSGLGLTLAQTFVQQHEGTIECESRPGQTMFRIVLPVDRQSPLI